MKILLVTNPAAGGMDHSDTIEKMIETVREKGLEPKIFLTNGKNDETALRQVVETVKPARILVGGGDGTIRMAASVLIPFKIPMGVVPMGSANGLATALGIPADPIEAVERAMTSTRVRPMDMLEFNGKHLCIHLGDIGVNALMVKKYHEANERGMMGYAKNLLSSIQESQLLRISIETSEGLKTTKEGYMMSFANANMYGTGVQISEGSVSDGRFEICNVERLALDSAIKAGLTILNVFVDKDMFSDVISCKEAEIKIDKKTHFQIDGEYMGMVDHLHIKVLPSTIKMLV